LNLRGRNFRGWKRIHKEGILKFFASPNITMVMKSKMRLAGHVARTGEMRNSIKILVGKPEGKRT
jgi:hypothetical protein